MGFLILSNDFLEEIGQLRHFAENHPISIDHQLDSFNGKAAAPGDYDEFTVNHCGNRIVFSVNEHPFPEGVGKVRVLSVSLPDKPGKLPHPKLVELIMGLLGFENDLYHCMDVSEKEITPTWHCINVIERFN